MHGFPLPRKQCCCFQSKNSFYLEIELEYKIEIKYSKTTQKYILYKAVENYNKRQKLKCNNFNIQLLTYQI